MSELRDTRLEKAKTLEELGQGPYALTFSSTHRMAELQETHSDLPKGGERDVSVSVAGRVMTRRVMGKLAFFTLADETGSIQLFLEKAGLEAQQEGWFKQITSLVDSGDWLGVSGTLRRTDRGELSVKVSDWRMLTKALQPFPTSGMDWPTWRSATASVTWIWWCLPTAGRPSGAGLAW